VSFLEFLCNKARFIFDHKEHTKQSNYLKIYIRLIGLEIFKEFAYILDFKLILVFLILYN